METIRTSLARYAGLIFVLLFSSGAFAQVKVVEGKYPRNLFSSTNFIKNVGCYENARDITGSGGSISQDKTNALENGASCGIDATTSGQTYTWDTFTLDKVTAGQNCEAKFIYQGDASLYKAYVTVNSVKASLDVQLQTSPTGLTRSQSINFPCGAQPLATKLVIEATSSSAAQFQLSRVSLGLATNIGSVNKGGSLLGKIRMSGCSDWSRSNTSYGSQTASAGCSYTLTGQALAPATQLPAIRFASIPEGDIYIVSRGFFSKTVTTTNAGVAFRFNDGTNTFSEQIAADQSTGSGQAIGVGEISGSFRYSSPQGSTTIDIQSKISSTASAAAAVISGSQSLNFGGSSINGLEIEVWHYPNADSSAVSAPQQKAPTFTRLTSGTGATYTVPPGAVFLKVTVQGGGGGGAGADTDNVYSGSGGGGGGCARAGIPFPAASYLYTIGSAGSGTAAATSPSTGGTGGTTTFGSILSAIGGTGGVGGTGGGSSGEGGTATVTGYTGEIFAGNPGGVNNIAGAQTGVGGGGGCYGGAGGASKSTNGNGSAGIANTGGGGGGGTATSGNGANAGTGVIFIEEYYSMGSVPLFIGGVVSRDNVNGNTSVNTAVSKSSNYTATEQEETLISAATLTWSLPAAASVKGKKYEVVTNGAHIATIDPNGSETICGQTTVKLDGSATVPDSMTIQSDGTNWVGLNDSCIRKESWQVAANSGGTGAVTGETGNPVNGDCSFSTNTYQCNFQTTLFSATPNCTATLGSNFDIQVQLASVNSTAVSYITRSVSGTAHGLTGFTAACTGPR